MSNIKRRVPRSQKPYVFRIRSDWSGREYWYCVGAQITVICDTPLEAIQLYFKRIIQLNKD